MKIICIGRNYREHARELNNPIPESPIFFLKPDTALVKNNNPVYYPEHTNDLHYEAEMVIKICKKGKHINEKFAHTYYQELAIGIDFTARDVQASCKQKGLPWEIAKAFDQSAPISGFIDKESFSNLREIEFQLNVNREVRQIGNTKDMMFSFNRIISYVSKFMTLKEGDLIFTGTPAGVGPTFIGDHYEAFIEGNKMLEFDLK
jgi:2-keto-4-pentenoate hydratase/2-oxohepta-3-ene-1,7-dioic acid hydratase in catechol pathway